MPNEAKTSVDVARRARETEAVAALLNRALVAEPREPLAELAAMLACPALAACVTHALHEGLGTVTMRVGPQHVWPPGRLVVVADVRAARPARVCFSQGRLS